MATKYTVSLTEDELRAIGLICSYMRHRHPLTDLDRDITNEFGEPDIGEIKFEVFEPVEVNGQGYDEVVGRFEEVIIDWPENWQKAWSGPEHKILRRTKI